MKLILFLLLLSLPFLGQSQSNAFPSGWTGNWKGELLWYVGNETEPKRIDMELRIHPLDSNQYTWQLIYGSADTTDNRPYILKAKDASKGHWIIDENNGIVLDQFLVANKLSGAFSVKSSDILNNYWLEGDKLHVEFYNVSSKPIAVTGKGTSDSPIVNSYEVKSYQKAILSRTH